MFLATILQVELLATFANMRVVPALTDTVAPLVIQKVIAELRLPVKFLQDLSEQLPQPSVITSYLALMITSIIAAPAQSKRLTS